MNEIDTEKGIAHGVPFTLANAVKDVIEGSRIKADQDYAEVPMAIWLSLASAYHFSQPSKIEPASSIGQPSAPGPIPK